MSEAEFEDGFDADAWDADDELAADAEDFEEFDDDADDFDDDADDFDDDADDFDDDADDFDDDADDFDDDADDFDDDADDFDDDADDDDFDDADHDDDATLDFTPSGACGKLIRRLRNKGFDLDKAGRGERLCGAVELASLRVRSTLREVQRVMNAKDRPGTWKKSSGLIRWFGMPSGKTKAARRVRRNRHMRQVRRKLRQIDRMLSRLHVTVRPQNGTGSGCCSKGATRRGCARRGSRRIQICEAFFVGSTKDLRAGLVIHECCHAIGMKHRRGVANESIDMQRALELALESSKDARRNPANYALATFEVSTGRPGEEIVKQ